MSSISDELRDWCKRPASYKELLALADRVDSEMVELPRDRDGVPIHVGDTVYDENGVACEVVSIGFGRWTGGMTVHAIDGSSEWRDLIPGQLAHTYPDSWERIAAELEGLSVDSSENYYVSTHCSKLADRIRKLARKEAER